MSEHKQWSSVTSPHTSLSGILQYGTISWASSKCEAICTCTHRCCWITLNPVCCLWTILVYTTLTTWLFLPIVPHSFPHLSLSLSLSHTPLFHLPLPVSSPLLPPQPTPPIQWLCRPWGSIQSCHFHYATPINHGIIILPNTVKEYLHYSSSPSTYQQLELGSRPQQHNTNRNSQMDIHILCTCTAVVY